MLDTLISSKTRIKLLQKFFLNSNIQSYLRGLESEFGDSTNSIRLELNRLEKAGMITSQMLGNKKVFRANETHPLFSDLQSIVKKYMGIDKIIDNVIFKLGDLQRVYVVGDYANGLDRGVIDLIFIGDNIDQVYLLRLLNKVEILIKRKVKYLYYQSFEDHKIDLYDEEKLMIWQA
jgi:hypothetical protein